MIKNNKPLLRPGARGPLAMGFSLVELVVSMTGGAAVFCLAIATIEQTMKLSNDGRARAEHQLTVARLGQQFRSDVHQVSEFRLEMDNGRQPSLTALQPAGASPGSPQLPAGQLPQQVVLTTHPLGNGNVAANDAPSRTGASALRLVDTHPLGNGNVAVNDAPSRTGASALRLTVDSGETITYTISRTTITREVTKPASTTISRETYRLHRDCSARLESPDRDHLSLLIARHPPDGGEMLENRIVARTGRLFSLQMLRKGQ